MLFFSRLSLALLFSLLMYEAGFSQPVRLYCDIGVQYTHFEAKDLKGVSNSRPNMGARFGFSYLFGQDNGFSAGAELAAYIRRMKRSMDEYHFVNRFNTIETALTFSYAFHQNWSAESGLAFLFYSSGQSRLRDTEAPTTVRIGEGFQSFDVAPFLGLLFSFSEHIAIGTRVRHGLLPMAKYQRISNYGSILPAETDLYATSFELFLRLKTF